MALILFLAGLPPARASQVCIRELRAEPATARELRHRRVAERRAGPMVIVHRGASDIAPENSLEAYAAAMDYGADGCEVDVRRTRDGVLVLFHDDMLDRLLEAVGEISELTFAELMAVRPRQSQGWILPCHGPPTFVALLELARQRAMLLHLDVKEPGLEDDIAALLDQAEVWDHVVSVNTDNATNLLRHLKLRRLSYKTGLFEDRSDMDPEAVRAALPGGGDMIIVDDPRLAARALQRPPHQPVPLPKYLCTELESRVSLAPPAPAASTGFNLHAFFRSLGPPAHERAVEVLAAAFPEGARPEDDAGRERRRTERIVERAWAAWAVGSRRKSSRLVALLEEQIRHRSLHRDWRYQGFDGVLAVQTLVQWRATESVPVLLESFLRADPDLSRIADPRWAAYPLVWRDFRYKMVLLPALGELRNPASKQFLLEYLALDEARVRELAPPQYAEAARALLRHDLTQAEIEALLRHRHNAVRGTAVLECLDRPTRRRTGALRAAAPWALALPSARRPR